MNIKITHSWLLEYLDTDVTPIEIQKYLSLCGPSIESVTKIGSDYVYDIEITSNRIDMASVIGIAREASAILPRFGKQAKLKQKFFELPKLMNNSLTLKIEDKNKLTNRVLAVIFENIRIGPSPQFVRSRLEAAGIRSLNNVVDVTNYVMLEIGHPTHVFDYDRIKTGKFVFRQAVIGETLVTLDGKKYELRGGEVVIDDGTGSIVDLPSIMGTENSVVTKDTKRVIFFVDNLNAQMIRQASMSHGIRTVAATYNEKKPDPELGYTALLRGAELLKTLAAPTSISPIIDFFAKPVRPKVIVTTAEFINTRMGVKLEQAEIIAILKKLEFRVSLKGKNMHVTPPSFRAMDVTIPEDIVEEVARIYGYHNFPSNVQSTVYIKQPKDTDLLFELQSKVKYFLKHLGLHEVMNYSMISEKSIANSELKKENHLMLKNTISEEIKYLRMHLLPSLFVNIKKNEGKKETLKFFEIAKTYKKRIKDLPEESYKLGIVTNTSFADLKGIIDALLKELNVSSSEVKKTDYPFLSKTLQGEVYVGSESLVKFGQLSKQHQSNYQIKKAVFAAVFDFKTLTEHQKQIAPYKAINPFAEIKLDLTIATNSKKSYLELKKLAFKTAQHLQRMEFLSKFEDKISVRFYFSSTEKNITDEEAKKELKQIEAQLTT